MQPDYELRSEDEKELMRLVAAWAAAALVDDERTARAALLNHYRASRAGSAAEPAPEAAAPEAMPALRGASRSPACEHGVEWFRCRVWCEDCGHPCSAHYEPSSDSGATLPSGGPCHAELEDTPDQSCDCGGFRPSPG